MTASLRTLVLLIALGFLAGAAHAEGVVMDKSEIRFVSKQLGVNVEGRFKKWNADVVFLRNNPGQSKANFDIELASIDLASDESEAEVRGPQWFDTAKFPRARFTSTAVKNVGGDKYEVSGVLSMKGVTHNLVIPIVLTRDAAGNSIAEGSFVVKRLDYNVGTGVWGDTETVTDDVLVRVRLVLKAIA
jgi:polyisoprenoid-binding protein YceI